MSKVNAKLYVGSDGTDTISDEEICYIGIDCGAEDEGYAKRVNYDERCVPLKPDASLIPEYLRPDKVDIERGDDEYYSDNDDE